MKIFTDELKTYLIDLNVFLVDLRKKIYTSAEFIYRVLLRSFFIIFSVAIAVGLALGFAFIIYKLFGLNAVFIFYISMAAIGLVFILAYKLAKPSEPKKYYATTPIKPAQYYAPITALAIDNTAEQLNIQKDILKAQRRIAANTAQTAFYDWQRNNESWRQNNRD